jgi:hypothetical protein
MVRLGVLVLLLVSVIGAFAADASRAQDLHDSPAYRLTLNNLSQEYLNCSIYYTLAAQCVGRRKEDQRVQSFEKAANTALNRAFLLGIEVGLSDNVTAARLQDAWNEQRAAIGNDCANMGVLSAAHDRPCKTLMEDYESVFRVYYKKALEELP